MRMVLYTTVLAGIFFIGVVPAYGIQVKIPITFTYINGLSDVFDIYKSNADTLGYEVSNTRCWPFGVSLHPFMQLKNGLGTGFGIGPIMLVSLGGIYKFYDFPLSVDCRYSLISKSKLAPYVRLGGRYHMAFGDFVKSSSPGVFVGMGLGYKLRYGKKIGMEFSYDTGTVGIENKSLNKIEDVQPNGILAGVYLSVSFFLGEPR